MYLVTKIIINIPEIVYERYVDIILIKIQHLKIGLLAMENNY